MLGKSSHAVDYQCNITISNFSVIKSNKCFDSLNTIYIWNNAGAKIRVLGLASNHIYWLRISMCSSSSAAHGDTASSLYNRMTHTKTCPPSGRGGLLYGVTQLPPPPSSASRQGTLFKGDC